MNKYEFEWSFLNNFETRRAENEQRVLKLNSRLGSSQVQNTSAPIAGISRKERKEDPPQPPAAARTYAWVNPILQQTPQSVHDLGTSLRIQKQQSVAQGMIQGPRNPIFSSEEEFPNLFTLHFKGQNKEERRQSMRLVGKAVESILMRIELPSICPKTKEVSFSPYYKTLYENLRKVVPGVKIFAKAETMCSVVGYLYEKLHKALLKNSEIDLNVLLNNVATDVRPLREEATKIFKVGSDFGVLLDFSDREISPTGKNSRLWKKSCAVADRFIRTFFENPSRGSESQQEDRLWMATHTVHRRVYVAELSGEGGSSQNRECFVLPTNHVETGANISSIEPYLCEALEYARPDGALPQPSRHAITINALIPLLETPFLEYSRDASRALAQDLIEVAKWVEQSDVLCEETMALLRRVVGHARFNGSNNRIYRSEKGSPLDVLLSISNMLQEKTKIGYPIASIFAARFPIDGRCSRERDLNGFPESYLVPVEEFIEKQTVNGVFFHGTGSMLGALSMARGGMHSSTQSQGAAAFGPGVYTSDEFRKSATFTNGRGLIFTMAPRIDKPINIINWPRIEDSEFIRALIEEKPELAGIDEMFQYLSTNHGIDAIINNHILIENSEAFTAPKTLRSILLGYTATKPTPWMLENLDDIFKEYSRLWAFINTLESPGRLSKEMHGVPSPSHFAQSIVRTCLQNIKTSETATDFELSVGVAIEATKVLTFFETKQALFLKSDLLRELQRECKKITRGLPAILIANVNDYSELLADKDSVSAFMDLSYAMYRLRELGLPQDELIGEATTTFIDAAVSSATAPSVKAWWYLLRQATKHAPAKVEALVATLGARLLDKAQTNSSFFGGQVLEPCEKIIKFLDGGLSKHPAVATWCSKFLALALENKEFCSKDERVSDILSLIGLIPDGFRGLGGRERTLCAKR